MPRRRTSAAQLARLCDAAALPIYAVDDERRIVYGNPACVEWAGIAIDELLGETCGYHVAGALGGTPEGAPSGVAAGLAPPPQAMAGELPSSVVCVEVGGRLRRRLAQFLPLKALDVQSGGVLVVLASGDLSDDEQPATRTADDDAPGLHDLVQRFRHQQRGRMHVDRLIGVHPAIVRARAQIALAADSDAAVLVVGPPGSGRSRVAKAIHYSRASAPQGALVPLDAAVLGAELLESTIDALARRAATPGRTEWDTLLISQVDRISGPIQAMLAMCLRRPLRGVRIVATAEESLDALARQGEYRADLAAQLTTLCIELPPLAHRLDDLPLLAQTLVEDANATAKRQLGGFTAEALDALAGYDWPGNVDELAEYVRAAHVRAEGPLISRADLPERIHLAADAAARPRRAAEPIVLGQVLADVEAELIRRALALTKGNKARAARMLGVKRARLLRRIAQLGIV